MPFVTEQRYRLSTRVKVILISIGILGGILLASWPSQGYCIGCVWTGTCYSNSICGQRCVCVKADSTDVGGFCAVR